MVVEFRRRTLLPLDDVLGCLRDAIPKLTRSSMHRCPVAMLLSGPAWRLPFGQGRFVEPEGYVTAPGSPASSANGFVTR